MMVLRKSEQIYHLRKLAVTAFCIDKAEQCEFSLILRTALRNVGYIGPSLARKMDTMCTKIPTKTHGSI